MNRLLAAVSRNGANVAQVPAEGVGRRRSQTRSPVAKRTASKSTNTGAKLSQGANFQCLM